MRRERSLFIALKPVEVECEMHIFVEVECEMHTFDFLLTAIHTTTTVTMTTVYYSI
jgi:hypothetical protein